MKKSVFIISLDNNWSSKLLCSFDDNNIKIHVKPWLKQINVNDMLIYILEDCWNRSMFERSLRNVYRSNIAISHYIILVPTINQSALVYANRIKNGAVGQHATITVISTNTRVTITMAVFWKWPTDSCEQTGIEWKYGDPKKIFSNGIVNITYVLSLLAK